MLPQIVVVASFSKKGRTLGGQSLQSGMKQFVNSLPTFGDHDRDDRTIETGARNCEMARLPYPATRRTMTNYANLSSGADLLIKPCFREFPIAQYCLRRHLQYFGRFFNAQTAKETKFDDPTLALVNLRQAFKRVIESY